MSFEKNVVLSIGSVEPGLVEAIKKHAARLGTELVGIALLSHDEIYNEHQGYDQTNFFKEIRCNFDDPDDIQRILKPYMEKILVATCRDEAAIQEFRKVAPFLPYTNRPSESSLMWSSDKYLMRDRLHNYDPSLTPHYFYLSDYSTEQLDTIIKGIKFPVVVKPSGLNSSLLVTRCVDKTELDRCLLHTFAVIRPIYERERGTGNPGVLIEEMMQGDMYSIDAYIGPTGRVVCLPPIKVITANSLGLAGFYAYRTMVPAPDLSTSDIADANRTCDMAVKALNLSSTTAHIELYKTASGWKIIEVGARMGGCREFLYRESYGIDHYYNDLANRMGLDIVIPDEPIGYAGGMSIYADDEGIIKSIVNLHEAAQIDGVVYFHNNVPVGGTALTSTNGGKSVVAAVVSNIDAEVLEQNITKLRELVTITVEAVKNN